MKLEEIRELPPQEAITALDEYIARSPEDEAFTLRGMKHWALGHRASAINDYLKAVSLNPASASVQLLENARSILEFYNKDLLNP